MTDTSSLVLRRKHTGHELPIDARPLSFGTWMGGDRDGNPNVTAATTHVRGPACLLAPHSCSHDQPISSPSWTHVCDLYCLLGGWSWHCMACPGPHTSNPGRAQEVACLARWMSADLFIREIDVLRFELSMRRANQQVCGGHVSPENLSGQGVVART